MEVVYSDWSGGTKVGFEQLDSVVQKVYQACMNNSSCEIIDLRSDSQLQSQSIVADFADGSFDARNPVGIHRVERLALTYSSGSEFCWEVRALRKEFPITIHQNHVLEGAPRSLCLYVEPWLSVERSWTPELFVKRIFWWLRKTAEGTIHDDDQPLEQLFFSSSYNVVLPENYFDGGKAKQKNISFSSVEYEGMKTKTLIGRYTDSNSVSTPFYVPISVVLDPVENAPIEEYPHTLGMLQSLLEHRGKGIVDPLKKAILGLVADAGIEFQLNRKEFVLLLLGVPRIRNGVVERLETQGFIVDSEIGALGESLSVLLKAPDQNKWYRDALSSTTSDDWKSLSLFPVNVKCYPSRKEVRQYSGLRSADQGPNGVIAGVGALGGLLAKIWNRECWGEWSYIDDDIVQAHNIVRHIASHHCIGYPKAVVVDSIVNDIHQEAGKNTSNHFVGSIISDDPKIRGKLDDVEIVIDATTTLHVPRVISRKDNFPRTASVFITPSGTSSVMLLEDKGRSVRCSSLEAQYYRAILNSEWGGSHLSGHVGRQWVGAGCREITVEISDELIHLHSAMLSRQIRKSSSLSMARICVWKYQDDFGGVVPHDVSVFPSYSASIGDWEVHWDDGFLADAKQFRLADLPNETGGLLFGIIDQKDRTITLVKACAAPENSESTPTSFGRGAYNSSDILDDCHNRTAGIVTYVGEWHSHPRGCTALPSKDDVGQLGFLAASLQIEGMPALMIIVADSSVALYLDNHGVVLEVK